MEIGEAYVSIETNEDFEKLCEKYNCKTVENLDEILWFDYGVSLHDKRNKKKLNIHED